MQRILIQEEQKFHTLCQMALHFIKKDESKNLKIMLQSGLNVNFKTYEGQTLLISAVHHNSLACAKMLLQEGALVDMCDTKGITPLMQAYYTGNLKMVKLLLDYGANPNIHNDLGITFYMLAILSGKWQIAELLLKHSDTSLSKRISLMIYLMKGNLNFKLPYHCARF